MNSSKQLLIAALASATWVMVPAAFAQQDAPPAIGSQDLGQPVPPAEDPSQSATATESSQDIPPETSSEDAMGAQTAPSATADTAPIEDQKIEQFADAYVAVQTIQQKAAADLQTASDPQQADKVKASAEADMIAAVERTGMQVPEFNRIVERMASDTEVRSRVAAKLQERSSGT